MNNPPLSLVARRRLLWRICLAQLPPDERERVLAEPAGPEALSFAVTVELFAREDPAKLHALLADPGNEIRTVYEDEKGTIHQV